MKELVVVGLLPLDIELLYKKPLTKKWVIGKT